MIYEALENLIQYGIKKELILDCDVFVIKNQLMEILKLSDWEECESSYTKESNKSIDQLLEPIIEYACKNKIIEDTSNSKDLFDTKIMGIFTPFPREVVKSFNTKYEKSKVEATNWYYDFSKNLNYVRAGRIAKDLKWTFDCEYGKLDITINCSKPEKDPRDIAAAKNQKSASYPKCQLCPENAGFAGHANHPARQNLRPIPLTVNNEKWQLQYSPYGYYNEHCIVFNEKHIPMKIDQAVFTKLFDIIDFLPHYFVGSNADLPIVGGSILTHEHFQGGNYTFAMETAPIEKEFSLNNFKDVKAGIVKWPLSVIRVSSKNKSELSKCCNHILEKWRSYTDEQNGIFAFTENTPHNTITPIARKKDDFYECDLVLRNNITTEERPLGVFHPNPTLHHIKKENIGLIEVMGLAVLPARLSKEIVLLEQAMLENKEIDSIPELQSHGTWAKEVLQNHPEFSKENARNILEQEIGKVFLEVLCDARVFKRTTEGNAAFQKFIAAL